MINQGDGDQVSVAKVEVQNLPEGYFRERLMEIAEQPTDTVFCVAKLGGSYDWAAYIGWPSALSEEGKRNDPSGYYRVTLSNEHGVLSHGDKLDEATARALFPNDPFKSCRYRR